MRFSIQLPALKNAIARVASGVPVKTSLPILRNILIEASDVYQTVKFTSFDLTIAIQSIHDAEVSECGYAALPAELISQLAKRLEGKADDQNVTFELNDSDECAIRCGAFSGTISGDDATAFPSILGDDSVSLAKINAPCLSELFARVIPAAERSDTRPALNALHLSLRTAESGAKILCMAATDGHRLHLGECLAPEEMTLPEGGALLSLKSCKELQKLLAEEKDDVQEAEFGMTSKVAVCRRGSNGLLITKLVDGVPPDYRSVIPEDDGSGLDVSVQSLSTALKISGVFSEDKSNTVVMRQSGHELAISANSGIGRGEVTVNGDLECPAQEVETAANAAYLLDALGACPMLEWNTGSVRVCLKPADTAEPIVLRAPSEVSKAGGDYSQLTAIVMPVRM